MVGGMDFRDDLLRIARTYGEATNRSLARVSTLATNDGKFFRKIEAGSGCTVDRLNRILRWFSDNWPATVAWPEGVARPVTAASGKAAA